MRHPDYQGWDLGGPSFAERVPSGRRQDRQQGRGNGMEAWAGRLLRMMRMVIGAAAVFGVQGGVCLRPLRTHYSSVGNEVALPDDCL
jgi:hypothetical protein